MSLQFSSLIKNTGTSALQGVSGSEEVENLSPAMMMLQVQMLMAENFDQQIRSIADKIKFLKDVVSAYRNNIAKIQTFLAQTTASSHHGNKQVVLASAAQMADLCGSLTTYNYNADTKTMVPVGIDLADNEAAHKLSEGEVADGKMNTLELQNYFIDVSQCKDEKSYNEMANKLGDREHMQMFVYFREEKADRGADGKKMFTVYVDQVEKLLEQMNAKISEIETDIEELSTKLTDLTEKRKEALDGANSTVKKLNEAQTNTISKF